MEAADHLTASRLVNSPITLAHVESNNGCENIALTALRTDWIVQHYSHIYTSGHWQAIREFCLFLTKSTHSFIISDSQDATKIQAREIDTRRLHSSLFSLFMISSEFLMPFVFLVSSLPFSLLSLFLSSHRFIVSTFYFWLSEVFPRRSGFLS